MTVRTPARLALAFASWAVVSVFAAGQLMAQAKISGALERELARSGADELVAAYVLLHEQADARGSKAAAEARGSTLAERSAAVIETLKSVNTRSQAPLVSALSARDGITDVRGRWLVNLVGFRATPARIRELALDPRVAAVHYDGAWVFESPDVVSPASGVPGGTEPGLRAIKANELWSLGYTGFGGVAFTADTGVDPFHPGLNHKYAGHDGRLGAFFQLNFRNPDPFDCASHGTHVTGTILGLDRTTADTVGVAPNAHWLGGAILCGLGTVDNIAAFQWALDPDGDPATDVDRPFVINNSWQDPSVYDEECTAANPYPALFDNLLAAGLAVVFSAGNDGPELRTITAPHSYNAGLVNIFTVGALDAATSSYPIADFSSRGPSSCIVGDTSLDIKPEVSAPGVSVRSTVPDGYGRLSGTSMAAPHVSGAILLLHEAFPELDGEELMLALYFSAVDLGEPGEDNVYGRGIIDVKAAYDYLIAAGNEPAPPARPVLGANVIAIEAFPRQCGSTAEATLTLRNVGSVALDSVSYIFRYGDREVERTASLPLAPSEEGTLAIAEPVTPAGEVFASVRLVRFDNQPADPRLDLGASFEVAVTDATTPTLVALQSDSSLCLGSPVLLELVSDNGDRRVAYFDPDPNFQYVLGELQRRYLVPSLDSAITLYGVNEYRRSGGPAAPADTSVFAFARASEATLNIRSTRAGIVRGFSVYAGSPGRILIEFEDTSDEVVGRATMALSPGWNRISLQTELEANRTYRVTATRSPLVGYVPDQRVRDEEVDGMIDFLSVTSGTAALQTGSFFLFDWEVGYSDGCAPLPVTLTPDSTRVAEERALVVDTEDPAMQNVVDLRDATAPSGRAYSWYVDGERIPDADGPQASFTPTRVGTHEVIFTTIDEQDCAEFGAGVVDVDMLFVGVDETAVVPGTRRLSPNPARDAFWLSAGESTVTRVEIVDLLGRTLRDFKTASASFPVHGLPSGSYRVVVTRADQRREVYPLEVVR